MCSHPPSRPSRGGTMVASIQRYGIGSEPVGREHNLRQTAFGGLHGPHRRRPARASQILIWPLKSPLAARDLSARHTARHSCGGESCKQNGQSIPVANL
jgi:hypothetical protein